jgi:acyl-CoA reductase-like NAD-dependent aldehyde dehydrogenase
MTKTIQSINPFTGEVNAEYKLLTREELDNKIKLADQTFNVWKKTPASVKKELFLKLANVFENNREEMARIQTIEMGMLYTESFAGLANTVVLTKWFANNFESVLADEVFDTE